MSQHNKKESASHASNTRQRKQEETSGSKSQKKQQTPNGSVKGNSSSSSSSNSNSNTSFTISGSSSTSSVKMQTHTKPNNGGNGSKTQLNKKDKQQKEKERLERSQLVLWRRPLQTSKYCALELIELLRSWSSSLLRQRGLLAVLIVLGLVFSVIYKIEGPHQQIIELVHRNTWFFVYWLGLGVLSSVGLGTGLHTFLLYLGPHIASVTLAGYECNSLEFPQPPYPDDIICPEEPYLKNMPNIWSIMSKVRLEAFLWGAGTALGELPPYFMAKAARMSGYDPDDAEELAEFEALNAKRNQKNLSLMDRGKLFMERVVERVGFFGILACASIPNPLFDLAGITCGHFLVPFWTFFGATLIGKAIIKMHIQKIFVIIAFNETLIERAVDLIATVPIFGRKLQQPFKAFLENQKQRLHRQQRSRNATAGGSVGNGGDSGNLLSKIFETFVIGMVCYFVVSIVNSLAQSYHKRLHKKPRHLPPAVAATAVSGSQKKHLKQKALRD
ncbi:vacuole membrane protein 1 isoform X2 [Drosophila hydei]|nr:vacuole membrane protein 1 isoform X2 [Drosophila hydei]XP_023177685.2 vacuole membrane protein 1 isoform X2 [Drosophila hydei]XP_023177686.2 vacuole membrane protein 1 isoform X2 [Drosophila hydei]XP_023177687.2 vacuole membrane protein 1 isoform X2 [Drosophila hydei]XP_023177688.2 vacuole membrane protein 1 isoform X2 [Drosophila hydei]XP_023177689.2 vacuole membrane protein 1 isoform X2 [Drosophila hydei]